MIPLKDALTQARQKDYRDNNGTFSAVFGLCHRTKKTGGDLIKVKKACTCGLPPNCKDHEMIGIKDMDTGKPYAVHIRLLFQFNEQEIYWI